MGRFLTSSSEPQAPEFKNAVRELQNCSRPASARQDMPFARAGSTRCNSADGNRGGAAKSTGEVVAWFARGRWWLSKTLSFFWPAVSPLCVQALGGHSSSIEVLSYLP